MTARSFQERSVGSPWSDVLWNVLGGSPESVPEPEVHRFELRAGDVVLLCSDGLTNHVGADTLIAELSKSAPCAEICVALLAAANRNGGSDNTTAVVARCL